MALKGYGSKMGTDSAIRSADRRLDRLERALEALVKEVGTQPSHAAATALEILEGD